MHVFIYRSPTCYLVSRLPFIPEPTLDHVWRRKQPDEARCVARYSILYEPLLILKPKQGALLDVRFEPAESYTPANFFGCPRGVRYFFGQFPHRVWRKSLGAMTEWTVYVKLLKVEELPR